MQKLLQDMRHSLRQLRKAPGFTVTVLLTLALGIGATTAIFTLVYDVMLRPLPFTHSDRLVVLEEQVAEFRDLGLEGLPQVSPKGGTALQQIAGRKRVVVYLAAPGGPKPERFAHWLTKPRILEIRHLIGDR